MLVRRSLDTKAADRFTTEVQVVGDAAIGVLRVTIQAVAAEAVVRAEISIAEMRPLGDLQDSSFRLRVHLAVLVESTCEVETLTILATPPALKGSPTNSNNIRKKPSSARAVTRNELIQNTKRMVVMIAAHTVFCHVVACSVGCAVPTAVAATRNLPSPESRETRPAPSSSRKLILSTVSYSRVVHRRETTGWESFQQCVTQSCC